jgi:uncharacterized protein involved in type VI secretion and phage assembly
MMNHLMNQVTVRAQQQGAADVKMGVVRSYSPDRFAVQVDLQPEGVSTGWIPLKSPFVGNGWGMFCAPSIGDVVEVDFQEGDGGVPRAGLRFFNDDNRPLAVPSGEFWLVHKSGASIKATNDGKITLSDPSGTVFQLSNDGNVRITGDLAVSGSVTAANDVTAGSISLKNHKHGGVAGGNAKTGMPE